MIRVWKSDAGILELSKEDLNIFEITKARTEWKCLRCNKQIKRGFICMGKGRVKYCLECANLVIGTTVKSLKSYIDIFSKIESILTEHKEEYIKNNVAESLNET